MGKKFLSLLLLLCLLGGCGAPSGGNDSDNADTGETALNLVTTTYPLYLFTHSIVQDVEGVTVSPLVNQEISCVHDYALTVNDMKLLEGADVLILNGGGLDEFVLSALSGIPDEQQPVQIDASASLMPLTLTNSHQDGSDHGQDPHFWMDPARAADMVDTIAEELCALDPDNADLYRKNADDAMFELIALRDDLRNRMDTLSCRELITFHDGFSYFADAFNLTILMAVEEEEGQTASAQVIEDAVMLVEGFGLPAVFTEENSSDSTAQTIAREAGVSVYDLSMLMSGPTENASLDTYLEGMRSNVETIVVALR